MARALKHTTSSVNHSGSSVLACMAFSITELLVFTDDVTEKKQPDEL